MGEVQLLRLQCKVAALIGDPPQWFSDGRPEPPDTSPPPAGLSGPYLPPPVSVPAIPPIGTYEELDISWEDDLEGDD